MQTLRRRMCRLIIVITWVIKSRRGHIYSLTITMKSDRRQMSVLIFLHVCRYLLTENILVAERLWVDKALTAPIFKCHVSSIKLTATASSEEVQ